MLNSKNKKLKLSNKLTKVPVIVEAITKEDMSKILTNKSLKINNLQSLLKKRDVKKNTLRNDRMSMIRIPKASINSYIDLSIGSPFEQREEFGEMESNDDSEAPSEDVEPPPDNDEELNSLLELYDILTEDELSSLAPYMSDDEFEQIKDYITSLLSEYGKIDEDDIYLLDSDRELMLEDFVEKAYINDSKKAPELSRIYEAMTVEQSVKLAKPMINNQELLSPYVLRQENVEVNI